MFLFLKECTVFMRNIGVRVLELTLRELHISLFSVG
jgi:hypothetical protein